MSKPNLQIIRPVELAEQLGVSKVTIWRWTKEGILPPPRKLGSRAVGYVHSEVEEWLERRPEALRATEGR